MAEPVTVTLDDLLALKHAGTLNDVLLEEQPADSVKSSMKRALLTHHGDHTHVASNVEALSLTKKALTVIDKALALEQVAALLEAPGLPGDPVGPELLRLQPLLA